MEFLTRSSFLYTCFSFCLETLSVSLTPYISLAFLLFASYLLQLSSYLVHLRRPSLFPSIYLTCLTNFPPFSFYTSRASLSPSYFAQCFISLSLYTSLASLCLYLSSDRSSGTAIPQAILPRCRGEHWGFEIVYGAYGGIRSTVVLRACATKHHLNAGTVSRSAEISRATFNSELVRVMKHTRCFKLTR